MTHWQIAKRVGVHPATVGRVLRVPSRSCLTLPSDGVVRYNSAAMTWFTLPSDLDLEEYASSFALPAQLAEFILDAENESEGFRVLRGHILDFAHSRAPEFTDWMAIYLELRLYPELPHVSIMALGLYPVFRAAADLLRRYTGGFT